MGVIHEIRALLPLARNNIDMFINRAFGGRTNHVFEVKYRTRVLSRR